MFAEKDTNRAFGVGWYFVNFVYVSFDITNIKKIIDNDGGNFYGSMNTFVNNSSIVYFSSSKLKIYRRVNKSNLPAPPAVTP